MATDASRPIAGAPRPNWELPDIVDIKMSRVPFRPRQHKYFRSALAEHTEATEFLVRLTGPVPNRALGPALFVGETQVAECEAVGDNTYRFLAFDHQRLEPGAPIAWGWLDAPPEERKRTSYRFEATR